jgi:hypothetical protein
MITDDKVNHALHALNNVLVVARMMAYERAPHEALAEVLDTAEYLPMLMLETRDRTAEFRVQLEGLVSIHPSFASAVQRFDGEYPWPR